MSSRSSASDWTKTSSRHGGSSKYRDCRLPKSKAVKSLVWLAGRNPRRVTGMRQYMTTYSDDDLDTRSISSLWSTSSWGSSGSVSEYYFLESRVRYGFDGGWESDGPPARRRKAEKKGGKKPRKGGVKHYESSSEESDSDSSAGSAGGADEYRAAPGVPPGFPPTGMMPGMMHGGHQPPGQFGYGAPPRASFTPRSMAGGFPIPPPQPGPPAPGVAGMSMPVFGGPFGRPIV